MDRDPNADRGRRRRSQSRPRTARRARGCSSRHSARVGSRPALRAASTQSVWAWRRPVGLPSGSISRCSQSAGRLLAGTAGSGSSTGLRFWARRISPPARLGLAEPCVQESQHAGRPGAIVPISSSEMEHRDERIVVETDRYRISGVLHLPRDGYRSRLTDYLNAAERAFLALTDVELDAARRRRATRAAAVSRPLDQPHRAGHAGRR